MSNPVDEGVQPPFDGTTVRRLLIRGLDDENFWCRDELGSLGSVLYLENPISADAPGSAGKARTRPVEKLEADRADVLDEISMDGLTFVADGDMGLFPESPEFYRPEYKYYCYKDWKETGDVFEGYREVVKNPKHEDLKAFIRLRGGRLTGSVSGKTDYLISDKKRSDAISEARKRNIPVINEIEFLHMALEHRFEPK